MYRREHDEIGADTQPISRAGNQSPVANEYGDGQSVDVDDDWRRVRNALTDAGVAGTADLGRFVSNPQHFRPSEFDERAAMPILLACLPTLKDPNVVAAVAGHLRRPWARPDAYPALHEAFVRWAPSHEATGWALGDALANAAERDRLPEIIEIATDESYGSSRQMIVMSLWRYGSDPLVVGALIELCADPDVSLQAMSALRRSVGNEAALPHLRSVCESHPERRVREQAAREIKKAERALS